MQPFTGAQDDGETIEERTTGWVMQTMLSEFHYHSHSHGQLRYGGDKSFSFNISTSGSFVLAGGRIKGS